MNVNVGSSKTLFLIPRGCVRIRARPNIVLVLSCPHGRLLCPGTNMFCPYGS